MMMKLARPREYKGWRIANPFGESFIFTETINKGTSQN